MPDNFRIALVQPMSHVPPGDDKNVADAVRYVEQAAAQGAQFVAFPETYPGPWRMPARFDARFWDEERGLYCDYDMRARAPIAVNTAATFMPLYAGLAGERQAQRLIDEHWLNPAEYAPDEAVRYRITTTSKSEPEWEARRYWRGPVWIILNWLLSDGLRRYGFVDLAEALRRDSLDLMERSGFREYYDARDGTGCGSPQFSWSAALAIEFLAQA